MTKPKTMKELKVKWKPIIVNENDLQNMEHIELSYTGELIPLEIVEVDTKKGAIAWLVYSLKKGKNVYKSFMEFHNITPDEISEAMK